MSTPDHPGPICSEEVENWLRSRGVKFMKCLPIPIGDFDEKKSRANQARPQPLVDEAVERYTVAMKQGAKFPPVVAYQSAYMRFVLIDGNNRHAAAKKAGVAELLTYVVDNETSSELIQLLTVEANAKHGEPIPTEWRVKQAIHLNSIGWGLDEACKAAGISRKTLNEAQALQRSDRRAQDLKVSSWLDLTKSSRMVLGRLPDTPVFMQAARTAIDTGMDHAEVKAMVRDVKALDTEGKKLRFLVDLYEKRKSERAVKKALGKSAHKISSAKTNLITGIGKIMHVEPVALTSQIVTVIEQREVLKRLEEVENHILELHIAVENLNREQEATANAS